MNLAPYGGNVEGVAAASLIHFGKRTNKLTLEESLTLAVIPQNPMHRNPAQPELTKARDRLFTLWCERHPEARRDANLVNLPAQIFGRKTLPFHAPHFAMNMLAAHQGEPELVTTLDQRMQRLLERHVHTYVERQKRIGVTNAAAMLVDTRDMGVKAAVGSADFFNGAIAGLHSYNRSFIGSPWTRA